MRVRGIIFDCCPGFVWELHVSICCACTGRCFDTGIVRSVGMYEENGMLSQPVFVSFVMGVASGMPADPEWLPLLIKLLKPKTTFQVIAIGRENVWPLLRYVLTRRSDCY